MCRAWASEKAGAREIIETITFRAVSRDLLDFALPEVCPLKWFMKAALLCAAPGVYELRSLT